MPGSLAWQMVPCVSRHLAGVSSTGHGPWGGQWWGASVGRALLWDGQEAEDPKKAGRGLPHQGAAGAQGLFCPSLGSRMGVRAPWQHHPGAWLGLRAGV